VLWQAKYPYTVALKSYAERELGYYGPVEELLSDEDAARLAMKRLEAALSRDGLPDSIGETTWEEVLSFHAALAAVALSGSLRLLHRFALAEAERARRLLRGEDERGLLRLARALGLKAREDNVSINWLYSQRRGVIPRILQFSLGLANYLRVAASLEDSRWRLSNSFLLGGRVYLDREGFEDLISARVADRIAELADEYKELEITRLRELGQRFASSLDYEAPGVFDPSLFPECIVEAVEEARRGNLSPDRLYMIATFLANINAPVDYLEDLLYASGAVSRAEARVIAEVLLSEARRYRPYKCEAALEKGVCSKCRGSVLAEYWKAIRKSRGTQRSGRRA